eukprot:2313033-Amphidinium_carterae.1
MPPQGDEYVSGVFTPKKGPPTPKPPPAGAPGGPPPPPPKGEAASSSKGGVQFGAPPAERPPPPMHMRGTTVTSMKPLSESPGATGALYYGDILSGSSDVQKDFNSLLPERASRLSIFSDQDGYHIPEGHPSSAVWPRKNNGTKNCFAITSSFDWKAKGPRIEEAQRNLYLSLNGPLTVTLPSGEIYQVPITGTPDRMSGIIGPTIEAFDIARSFDYLLGHMLEHEYGLIRVVRRELEDKIAKMTNEELLREGAAWFGWHTDRRTPPANFIPTELFNSPGREYVLKTREDFCFADIDWEMMMQHLWPIEMNYFSLSWKERRETVMDIYGSKSLTAKQMLYYIGLYGITERSRRAKAQHLGAWALDCMWAEVRARINRVDAVATKKMIHDSTISILMRNLRIIRGILVALIESALPRAEADKFWKWEPGFGYQKNGKITTESQTMSFGPEVASSPMEMNTPRGSHDDGLVEGVRRFSGPQNRATSSGSTHRPRSPKPPRSNSRPRGETSGDSTPRTNTVPTSFGPDSTERSRSARRQRPDEAETEPRGGEDPGEQVDFSTEEMQQDLPPAQRRHRVYFGPR